MTPETLAALHARCFVMPRPWRANEFASLLETTGVFLIPGDAGFALGREIAGEAELLTLAVDPDRQRRGKGHALLSAFEAEAAKLGAKDAFLEVAENNAAARALYRTAGYTESGRRQAYYRPPAGPRIAAILLRKPLI